MLAEFGCWLICPANFSTHEDPKGRQSSMRSQLNVDIGIIRFFGNHHSLTGDVYFRTQITVVVDIKLMSLGDSNATERVP